MAEGRACLTIDTSLHACCVALVAEDGALLDCRKHNQPRGHAEHLPFLVRHILDEAEQQNHRLARLVVTRGPGSFTGLRTGLAFALGLARSRNLPLRGVSTLEALALTPEGTISADTLVLINARHGRVYSQYFSPLAPQEAAQRSLNDLRSYPFATHHRTIIDDETLRSYLPQGWQGRTEYRNEPDPASLGRYGWSLTQDNHPPSPLYLRQADVSAAKQMNFTLQS